MRLNFNLNAKRGALILLVGALVLIASSSFLGLIIAFLGKEETPRIIRQLFKLVDLDGESNLASMYSTMLLFISSGLLYLAMQLERSQNGRFVVYWLVLMLGFLLMGIDETIRGHEKLSQYVAEVLDADDIENFAWAIPAGGIVAILGLVYLRFLQALPGRITSLFLIAGVLYVLGAVGFELVGGHFYNLYSDNSAIFRILSQIEETLEMVGVILFIYALLEYLTISLNFISLKVNLGEETSSQATSSEKLKSPITASSMR